MPSIITSNSFFNCYSLSKIYIGKDAFIGKMDLSTTNIKHFTTPEKYDPNEKGVIAIESKENVKLSVKEEEVPNPQIEELNNTITDLKQELSKEKLDKDKLIKRVGELDEKIKVVESTKNSQINNTLKSLKDLQTENKNLIEKVNTLTTQLDNALRVDELVYNLLGSHSSKKTLLEKTQEVVNKVNDLNSTITTLQNTVKSKDNEISAKNSKINSLEREKNNPAWIDRFVNLDGKGLLNAGLFSYINDHASLIGLAEYNFDNKTQRGFVNFSSSLGFVNTSSNSFKISPLRPTNSAVSREQKKIKEILLKLTKL